MKRFSVLFVLISFLLPAFVFGAETLIVSAATTGKKLVVFKVEFSQNKYKVVDRVVFDLPFQAGLTAIAPLQNGNYQIVWTAQDATKKTKLHSMVVNRNLDKVGNSKKFPFTLTSHFNMNILTSKRHGSTSTGQKNAANNGSAYSYDSLDRVVTRNRNENTGNPFGPTGNLFLPPVGVDLFDTSFADDLAGKDFYAALLYIAATGDYGIIFGNSGNPDYTSAFQFAGDVVSGTLLPVPGVDDYNFIHIERLNNPERYRIANRRIDGLSGQPQGNLIQHVPPRPGNLGTIPFFNIIEAVPSVEQPDNGHVIYINEKADVRIYRINLSTGRRNSTWSDGTPITTDDFFYALSAVVESQ